MFVEQKPGHGHVVLNDHAYHFVIGQAPQNGDLAIVVHHDGVVTAERLSMEAWDEPGAYYVKKVEDLPAGARSARWKIWLVGIVSDVIPLGALGSFDLPASDASVLTGEANSGAKLRRRIAEVIRSAAEDGKTECRFDVRNLSPREEGDVIEALQAAGYRAMIEMPTLTILWD